MVYNGQEKNANNFANLPQDDFHQICKLYSSHQKLHKKHQEVSLTLKKIMLRRENIVATLVNLTFHLFRIKTSKLLLAESPFNE